jgi:hypothetical protein
VGFPPGDAHILFFRQPITNFQNGKNLHFSCGSPSKKTFIYIYHLFMTHHLEEQGEMDGETLDNYIYICGLHTPGTLIGDTNRWMVVILPHTVSTISTQVLIFYRTQFHIMKDKET